MSDLLLTPPNRLPCAAATGLRQHHKPSDVATVRAGCQLADVRMMTVRLARKEVQLPTLSISRSSTIRCESSGATLIPKAASQKR